MSVKSQFCLDLLKCLIEHNIMFMINPQTQEPFTESERQQNINHLENGILRGKTDCIQLQYEGGFKTWEGCFDLVDYIKKTKYFDKNQFKWAIKNVSPVNILDVSLKIILIAILYLIVAIF